MPIIPSDNPKKPPDKRHQKSLEKTLSGIVPQILTPCKNCRLKDHLLLIARLQRAMTVEIMKKLTTISNLNTYTVYGRRTELLNWPDKQRKTSSIHTLLTIPTRNTIPMMILSHYTKEGSIRYPQQTHFFLTAPCTFFIIFLFFYLHVSSSLSISVTHLLHVVTILRNRKRGLCQRAYLHTGFVPHTNHPILATPPPQKNSRLYYIEHHN